MASSIKCPRVYRALRDRRGMSKTKAAKISNAMARRGQCGATAKATGHRRGGARRG